VLVIWPTWPTPSEPPRIPRSRINPIPSAVDGCTFVCFSDGNIAAGPTSSDTYGGDKSFTAFLLQAATVGKETIMLFPDLFGIYRIHQRRDC
jgi:hypothetical protein